MCEPNPLDSSQFPLPTTLLTSGSNLTQPPQTLGILGLRSRYGAGYSGLGIMGGLRSFWGVRRGYCRHVWAGYRRTICQEVKKWHHPSVADSHVGLHPHGKHYSMKRLLLGCWNREFRSYGLVTALEG